LEIPPAAADTSGMWHTLLGSPRPTVRAVAALAAGVIVLSFVADGPGWWLFPALILALATVALMAGSQAAWIFLALVAAGDIVLVAFGQTRHPTTTFMLNAVVLGLLLAPSTRQWVRRAKTS
jgi:hypothetical protein